jgi:hypothetical protein
MWVVCGRNSPASETVPVISKWVLDASDGLSCFTMLDLYISIDNKQLYLYISICDKQLDLENY